MLGRRWLSTDGGLAVGHFVLRGGRGRRIGRPPGSPGPGHLQAVDQAYHSYGEHGADGCQRGAKRGHARNQGDVADVRVGGERVHRRAQIDPNLDDDPAEPPGQHQALARDTTQVWQQRRRSRVTGRDHVVDDLLGEPKVDHRPEPATNHHAATTPVPSRAEEFSVTPGAPEPDNEHDARGHHREPEASDGQNPNEMGTIQAAEIVDPTLDIILDHCLRVPVRPGVHRLSEHDKAHEDGDRRTEPSNRPERSMCISQRRQLNRRPWGRLRVLLERRRRNRLRRLLRWLRGWLLPGLLGTLSVVTRFLAAGIGGQLRHSFSEYWCPHHGRKIAFPGRCAQIRT